MLATPSTSRSSLVSTLTATLPVLLAAATLACATGCTTRTQAFEGYADETLWNAMVASAKAPMYDDWKVMDNQVYSESGAHSIEVYRVLRRTRVTPDAAPATEERDWRFRIELTHGAAGESAASGSSSSSVVQFTARQLAVPAHVWKEADRYFAQVRQALDQPTASAAGDASTGAPAGK